MNQTDEWGRDPSVQIMRKVFKAMEDTQARLFQEVGIDLYDGRIRPWREKALLLFERSWVSANRMGVTMDEGMASILYIHSLVKIMDSEGVDIPMKFHRQGEAAERFFRAPD